MSTPPPRARNADAAGPRRDWAAPLVLGINQLVNSIARHWLLLANVTVGVIYNGLPIAAPVLMRAGHTRLANLLYRGYSLLCHQLPERSFFLFGPQVAYSLDELGHLLDGSVPLRYVGDPSIGYKVAVCQRDIATYLTWLIMGVVFAFTRRHWRPISIRAFIALCVPMALDGIGQLVGLWQSTVWSRVTTGALFGAALVLLAYPYIEQGMSDVRRVTETPPGRDGSQAGLP